MIFVKFDARRVKMQNASTPKFNEKFERQGRPDRRQISPQARKSRRKNQNFVLNFPVPTLGITRSVRGSYIAHLRYPCKFTENKS